MSGVLNRAMLERSYDLRSSGKPQDNRHEHSLLFLGPIPYLLQKANLALRCAALDPPLLEGLEIPLRQ